MSLILQTVKLGQRSCNKFATIKLKSLRDSVMLSQMVYWTKIRHTRYTEGIDLDRPPQLINNAAIYWTYKSVLDWSSELGLAPSTIQKGLKSLSQLPFVHTRTRKKQGGGFISEFGIDLGAHDEWLIALAAQHVDLPPAVLQETLASLNFKNLYTKETIVMALNTVEYREKVLNTSLPWCDLISPNLGQITQALTDLCSPHLPDSSKCEAIIHYILTKNTYKNSILTLAYKRPGYSASPCPTEEGQLNFAWVWEFYKSLHPGTPRGLRGKFTKGKKASGALGQWCEVLNADDLSELLPLMIVEATRLNLEKRDPQYRPRLKGWLEAYNSGSLVLGESLAALAEQLEEKHTPANDWSMAIERLK